MIQKKSDAHSITLCFKIPAVDARVAPQRCPILRCSQKHIYDTISYSCCQLIMWFYPLGQSIMVTSSVSMVAKKCPWHGVHITETTFETTWNHLETTWNRFQFFQLSIPAKNKKDAEERRNLLSCVGKISIQLCEGGSIPYVSTIAKIKAEELHCIKIVLPLWCERRDLNPYVKNTRPSNVRVCRFRHSRSEQDVL